MQILTGLSVNKVTITGCPLIGKLKRIPEHKTTLNLGAKYFTNQGLITGRIDDFEGVRLIPSLHPGAFEQTFVDGPVLDQAWENLCNKKQLKNPKRISPLKENPIDWDKLTFSLTPTDIMYYATVRADEIWLPNFLVPFDDIEISPAAAVLNYGQGIFEGMKAYRTEKGNIVLFRPTANAHRMQKGAKRLALTPVPETYFLEAVRRTVLANQKWIPPLGKGSLYIRPLLIGSGPVLGVNSAPAHTFLVYVSPVGAYFKGGMKCVDLIITKDYHRAPLRGTGNIKAIGNYAPGIVPKKGAEAQGYAEVIFLDAREDKYIEEAGTANAFFIKDHIIYTPELSGSILPGITRASIIQLAQDLGYAVSEERISIEFALQADEAFCSGTAAVISPVGSIKYEENTKIYSNQEVGPVTALLFSALTGIQEQSRDDNHGWIEEVIATPTSAAATTGVGR